MSFRFSVPTPAAGESKAGETRLKVVQSWVETLPTADTTSASTALTQALYWLNRTSVGTDERFKLMETYRPVVFRLLDELAYHYADASVPLPERAREAVKTSRELLIECAYGYKLMLLQKSDRLFASKKQLAVMLHRAITLLSDLLSLSYKTYSPTPAGVWHEIHQVFHYAQHFGLEETPLDSDRRAKVSSIALVYKQALLLSLADPYRLTPAETEQILALVQKFSSGALILPYSDQLTGPGLFLIRSDTDKPPKLLSGTDANIAPVDKVLIAANIAYTLGEVAGRLDTGMSLTDFKLPSHLDAAASVNLCRRLQKSWSAPPKRGFQRSASAATVEVCFGVNSVAQAMLSDDAAARAGVAARVTDSLDFARGTNVQAPLKWEILNQSAGGLALKRPADNGISLGVGEIVGIRFDGVVHWGIGAVRWVHVEEGGEIQFGMQLLAPSGELVIAQSAMSANWMKRTFALLLPELPAVRRSTTMLVPRGSFSDDHEYFVEYINGKRERLRASRLIEQTPSYDAIAYGVLGGPASD